MKRLLMLIVGIALLYFALTNAGVIGGNLAGGNRERIKIPVGSIKIEMQTNGE